MNALGRVCESCKIYESRLTQNSRRTVHIFWPPTLLQDSAISRSRNYHIGSHNAYRLCTSSQQHRHGTHPRSDGIRFRMRVAVGDMFMPNDDAAVATHLHGLAAMTAQHFKRCLDPQLISQGTSRKYHEEASIHRHGSALPTPFWPDNDFVQAVLAMEFVMWSALRQEGFGDVLFTRLLEAADSLGACVAMLKQLQNGSLALTLR